METTAPVTPVAPQEVDTLVKISHRGFTFWCDGFRAHGGTLIFISMFGVQASVRAAWAHIVRQSRPSIEIGPETVSLADLRYQTIRTLIDHQYAHFVVIHPDATSMVSPFNERFFLVGERPEVQYWTRFNRMCQVPVRDSWRAELWALGLENKLILPLDGMGLMKGYRVETTSAEWSAVVSEGVRTGRFT
jgi:hypothetical protein